MFERHQTQVRRCSSRDPGGCRIMKITEVIFCRSRSPTGEIVRNITQLSLLVPRTMQAVGCLLHP